MTAIPISINEKIAMKSENGSLWVDLTLLILVIALFIGTVQFGREWFAASAPASGAKLALDLSLTSLPGYALMSFARGILAYFISLIFSLMIGGFAARNRTAERILIPLLDVLQGIPVLGFMPGIVITMVSIFPHNNVGLELSCILMIFTAQTWNLAFAFYGSVRSIPTDYREIAQIHHFSWWEKFKKIELPVSAIPMVWNSMMSMAGGWFFLTVNEAFKLGNRDYRVPGIGSYMSLAIEKGDTPAIIAAIISMCLIIILSDRLIWNPLSIWSLKFRMDDSTKDISSSAVLRFLAKSIALKKISIFLNSTKRIQEKPITQDNPKDQRSIKTKKSRKLFLTYHKLQQALRYFLASAFTGIIFWALIKVILLSSKLNFDEWSEIFISLGLTFSRTTACLMTSILWAVPTGILIGRNSNIANKLQPIVQLLASFPAPMLYPLGIAAIIYLNINFQWGCTLLMLMGAQWYVLFNTIAGAQSIPSDLREVGEIFKMSRLRRWIDFYIPSTFPSILTGLVTAAGGAWNASIISEIVHYKNQTLTARGLGSLITLATEAGNMPLLCASVGVMATALVCINRLVWKPLFRLADQRFSMNR